MCSFIILHILILPNKGLLLFIVLVLYITGDYLSFRNGKIVQKSQSDNFEAEDRLEGLVMAISDFHAMMNLLNIQFKTSFTVSTFKLGNQAMFVLLLW